MDIHAVHFTMMSLRPFYSPATDEEPNDCMCLRSNMCSRSTEVAAQNCGVGGTQHVSLHNALIVYVAAYIEPS